MTTEKIAELKADKQTLRDWLDYCLKREDWHGVMDAAADIREIEAKIEVLLEAGSIVKEINDAIDRMNKST